ncbi:MAG: hypothetical protein AAGF12_10620 [Myxococcota bacterium]
MTMRFALLAGCVLAVAPTVHAQEVDVQAELQETQAVEQRLRQEANCIREQAQRLERTLMLMNEAIAQMRNPSAGERARQDARDAIRSLRQRRVRIEREALGCRQPASRTARSDAPIEGVVYQPPSRDPAVERVGQPNSATHVVDENLTLGTNVRVVRGERVDGRGRIGDDAVRRAVRSMAPHLGRCYDRMVGRGALQRGQVMLTFTIDARGAIHRVRTDQSAFPASFNRCLQTGARRGRTSPGPSGGSAQFSYTLAFPGS